MQSNERRLIQDLFARLRDAEHQRRDPEVERLLASELQQTPHAVYTMAQTIIAQNQALETAARRIEELENGDAGFEDEEQERYGRLPGAMGTPDLGRRGSVPQFGRGAAPQGGGFLANAGQIAMGVAGGMLIGEAAKSLLGSGSEAQASPAAAADTPSTAADDAGADNQLAGDAGVNDIGADAGESGGGGLFGWLFGDGGSGGANDTADGGWDDGGDFG